MATPSGELSNTCPVRYSARLRSVMLIRVTSTLSSRPGGGDNVIVNSTVSLSPFKVWRTVSASQDVRPSAMATSTPTKAWVVSGRNILCRDIRSSSLLCAANNSTVASLTSAIFTIAMACSTNSGCSAQYSRKSRTPLAFRSSIAALTSEKSCSQIDTRLDWKILRYRRSLSRSAASARFRSVMSWMTPKMRCGRADSSLVTSPRL